MKVKKTYTRQKKGKPLRNGGITVNNINVQNSYNFFVVCNFSNTANDTTSKKPDSSKSESSDLFDKIVKGPTYNQYNQSSFCLSAEYTKKFFSQRQDTQTFYKSDAELSISSEISNPLFKDSKNSTTYSPNWESPPEYRKIKNKLVKVTKNQKLTIESHKKISHRVFKKRTKVQKQPRFKKNVPQAASLTCTSSTPNRSNGTKKDSWPSHVSPIMPLQYSSQMNFHPEHDASQSFLETQKSVHGLSALIGGFKNLGINTPHRGHFLEVANKEAILFDYQSPLIVPTKFPSRLVDKECSPSLPRLNRSENLTRTNNLGCGKEIAGDSLDSSLHKKELEEIVNVERSETSMVFCKSPSLDLINPEEINECDNIVRMKEEINDNLASDSSPDEELKFGKVKTEDSVRFNDFNSSSPVLISKEKLGHPEEINVQHNLIRIKEEGTKLLASKKDHEDSYVIGANCETSLPEVLKACENTMDIFKRTLRKENARVAQYGFRDGVSLPPLASRMKSSAIGLNETLSKINLDAGKKWRRSLLRQKQSESKFERRVSMSAETLVKLIKESSVLSTLPSDTKVSWNNTFRITDSLLENQESRNNSLSVSGGSSVFDFSFSKLTRRRQYYVHDMNLIPEESSDHSSNKSNEIEPSQEPLSEQYLGNDEVYEDAVDTTCNRTDVFETPPILKMNPEALSAITDRKKSRRYPARSWGESSIFSDNSAEENEISHQENNLLSSFLSVLEIEDGLENLNEEKIKIMGEVGFLIRCGQQPTSFNEAFPERVLENCKKIGEGVFGEVFMLNRPEGISVIKVIPVEGSQMVNGAPQKRFDEVLSELIITEELSLLRQNKLNCTSGFCELKNKFYLKGQYPSKLLKLWKDFKIKKKSENESPAMFGEDQLYLGLELAHAGEPVETFSFRSPQQALAVFLQTTFSIAVAESAADFEHRDLHIGNVLVNVTPEEYVTFILNGIQFETPTYGAMATIIDYTLSRISFKSDVLYFDLEKDPEMFEAVNDDYQFDVYRDMRADLNHNWRDHQPKTNVRWLHYLVDKLTSKNSKIKYRQKRSTKLYKEYMEKLLRLKDVIMDFYSATDLAQHLTDTYSDTESLIRK